MLRDRPRRLLLGVANRKSLAVGISGWTPHSFIVIVFIKKRQYNGITHAEPQMARHFLICNLSILITFFTFMMTAQWRFAPLNIWLFHDVADKRERDREKIASWRQKYPLS